MTLEKGHVKILAVAISWMVEGYEGCDKGFVFDDAAPVLRISPRPYALNSRTLALILS